MNSLLKNMKVLDFTTLLPGPFATMMLADLGADVLRVESPTRLDLVRLMPPYVDDENQVSCFHAYLNRNKKSIALDLKNKESLPIIEKLIMEYDIIIEQFRPGVMERLGLSYEQLKKINPNIIYCSLTGYGQTGPLRDRAGHDINYLSLSGVMSYSGTKANGPALMGIQIADVGSGSNNAIISILAATISRMTSGKGQYIDISMTDGLFPYHALTGIQELSGGKRADYESEWLNGGSLYGFYETSDKKYISFGGIEPQFFNRFCDALDIQDLKEGGIAQMGKLEDSREKITDIIKSKTQKEWIEIFKDMDACLEPVVTFKEAAESPHAKERELLIDVPGPDGKQLSQIACPIKFSDFKPEYKRCGCKIGEDTVDILKSIGLSDSEIEGKKKKGVLG